MQALALLLAALGCALAAPHSSSSAAPRVVGALPRVVGALRSEPRSEVGALPLPAESAADVEERPVPAAALAEPALRFDRYHATGEIARAFAALEARHPRWFRAGALGFSAEGRALPFLEVRDFATGSEMASTALWIDGAIHGGELESAEVVLRVAEELRACIARGEAPRFLRRTALYLAPVLNPDGRERALAAPPRPGRNNGAPDGGVDLNRDFPARWSAAKAREVEEAQPESAAVMSFWRAHPEIALAVSFHTSVRAFLQPPLPMSRELRARYDELAELYQERLGLPRLAVPSHARGTTMDWFFAARGTIAFTLEIEGAHAPDAPLEERSPGRTRELLEEGGLERLASAHAELLLELAGELERRGVAAARQR
ncbi:MAG: succinylglutamate desuccinylase/aspartoacylase family protein [Planctomycetes bacterium]|nr:succinylglutamate desuccinylase/aspartoacylase family protein [Planctomycetota bacterium]